MKIFTRLTKSVTSLPRLALVALGMLGFQQSQAQQAVICPPNIDFNAGNFTNWTCYTGTCCPINAPTLSGPITNRHTITSGPGFDPYGGFPIVAPGGGTYSLKLGNSSSGSEAERVRYTVSVPPGFNNYSFGFQYAVVLEVPAGHTQAQMPRFEVKAYNAVTNAPIVCATLTYVAGVGLPGFQNAPNSVIYLPWTQGSINLSGQGGNTIIVEVSSGDCSLGAHFGYGYFDVLSCGQFQAAVANCNLDSNVVKFSGPPGYQSYVWRDSANTFTYGTGQTITLPAPPVGDSLWAKVILTPFNSNGCPDTVRTPTIRNFKINATPDTICNSLGGAIQLNVGITAGAPAPPYPYKYLWTPNATLSNDTIANPIATPMSTGYYYAKVTDTVGCFRKDTIFVQNPHFTVNAGPDRVTCLGTPYTIPTVVTPASNAYIYSWTPTTNLSSGTIKNPIYTPAAVGTETFVVRVDSGICARKDTIAIRTLPNTFSLNDTTICEGVTFLPTTSTDTAFNNNFTFHWSPGTNVSNVNILRPSVTGDTTRTYTITASYPGCPQIPRSFKMTVEPNPIVNLGPDLSKCQTTPLYIFGDVKPAWFTNYTYQWNPDPNINNPTIPNIVFTGQKDTTLILTVNTPIGCVGKDSIHIHVYNSNFASITPSDTSVCPRDSVVFRAVGGAIYQWVPGTYLNDSSSATVVSHPIASQGYTLYVTDVNGCKDTVLANVHVNAEAVLSLPDTVTIWPGETYNVNPTGNCLYYNWFPVTGLSSATIANPVAAPDVNTRYIVHASTEAGCTATDSLTIMVNDESALDVPNAFSPGSQPNAVLKIVRRGAATLSYFRIYNRWGTKVFEGRNIDDGWDGSMNGQPQPMGVYVYQVEAFTKSGKRFYKQGNVTLIR